MADSDRFPFGPPPTNRIVASREHLAAFDAAAIGLASGLPPSYQDFAATYGLGLAFGRTILFVPLPGHPEDLAHRSPSARTFTNRCIDDDLVEYEPDGDEQLVRRLVPFGISEDGHHFGWDPDEHTDGEHAIYVLGSKMLSVTRAAADLYELFARCADDRVRTTLGSGYRPLPPTFAAAVSR